MKDERAKIGDILKRAIKEQGYTQEEFADKVGIGFSSLKNYLNGTKVYNYELLIRFADVLECSYDYLLGKSNSPIREHTDVSNATGLSDEAIDKLEIYAKLDREDRYRQAFYNAMNIIICSDGLVNSISNYLLWDNKFNSEIDVFNDVFTKMMNKNEIIRTMGMGEIPISIDSLILLEVINRLNEVKQFVKKEYAKNSHSDIAKGIESIKAVSCSQDEN